MRVFGIGIGFVVLAVSAAVGAPRVADARDALVEDLEELARWCTKKKLLRSRNRLYEIVLRFDPDHEKARYWLRYERQGKRWVRTRPYREPRDFDEDALPEFRERRAEAFDGFVGRIWPFIEHGGSERAAAIAAMLTLDPDHPETRAANGEQKLSGRWVLAETATALRRRREIRGYARTALGEVPALRPDAPTAAEQRLGVAWTCAFRSRWWRFVSTASPEETRLAMRYADASVRLVTAAIHDRTHWIDATEMARYRYTRYYLVSERQARRLLAAHPDVDDVQRKRARALSGTWIARANAGVGWRSAERSRVDATTRGAISLVLRARYEGLKRDWIREGFGLYLTWQITRTRLTFYVERTRYASPEAKARAARLTERLDGADADWLAAARDLWREKPPDFRFLESKTLNQLTLEDLVFAHAVAAYFVEGRPRQASKFLAASVEHDLTAALRDACGLGFEEFQRRLRRWLEETTD